MIYQVPVIRVKDLNYGTYTVEISGVPARNYNKPDDNGNPTIIPTYLYVDGLRIYQPMGLSNDNYTAKENGATFAEIRNLIMDRKVAVAGYDGESLTVSTGTITWTENRNGKIYNGTAYTGNQVNSINDYLTLGPNNEVYMDGDHETAALVFYVEETGSGTHNLQIAVHGVDSGLFYGSNSTPIEAVIQYGVDDGDDETLAWQPLVKTTSATEQYYTIDYTKCPYVAGKGYQVAVKVDSGMASYTSLKYNGLVIDENVGESTSLEYVNGILTDTSNTTESTALVENDYPAFFSLRSQLMATALYDEESSEEESTEETTTAPETEASTEESTEESTEASEAEASTEGSTEVPGTEESTEAETPKTEESSEVETPETEAPETTVPTAPETEIPETKESTEAETTKASKKDKETGKKQNEKETGKKQNEKETQSKKTQNKNNQNKNNHNKNTQSKKTQSKNTQNKK